MEVEERWQNNGEIVETAERSGEMNAQGKAQSSAFGQITKEIANKQGAEPWMWGRPWWGAIKPGPLDLNPTDDGDVIGGPQS